MAESNRDPQIGLGARVGLGTLAAICVPFVVTGIYRLTAGFDSPEWFWGLLPFALVGVVAILIRKGSAWTAVSNGMIVGSVLYGLFLAWLLSVFLGST